MIPYRRVYFGLHLLPRVYGSAVPRSIFFAAAGSIVTHLLGRFASEWVIGLWINITCFTVFSVLVSFWVVFRCSQAYVRYWEGGCLKVAEMAASFANTAALAAAFDGAPSEPGGRAPPGHAEFVERLAHLLSLLQALILMHLRGDWDLDNILREDLSEEPPPVDPSELSNFKEVFQWSQLFMLHGTDESLSKYSRATPMRVIGGLPPEERAVLEPLSGKTHSKPSLRIDWPLSWEDGGTSQRSKARKGSSSSAGVVGSAIAAAESAARTVVGKVPKTRWRHFSVQYGTAPYQFGRCSRVQTAYRWVQRHLAARIKTGGLDLPAPIVSQLWPSLFQGYKHFESLRKLVDVPFPFPAAQLLTYTLIAFSCLLPFFYAGAIQSPWLASLMTFFTILSYWGVNECARDLEDVTVLPPNEIPLARLQYQFNERLAVLLQPWGAEEGVENDEDVEQPPLRDEVGACKPGAEAEANNQIQG